MKKFIDLYKYLMMVVVLNVPLLFLVLVMDFRQVDDSERKFCLARKTKN